MFKVIKNLVKNVNHQIDIAIMRLPQAMKDTVLPPINNAIIFLCLFKNIGLIIFDINQDTIDKFIHSITNTYSGHL